MYVGATAFVATPAVTQSRLEIVRTGMADKAGLLFQRDEAVPALITLSVMGVKRPLIPSWLR
jgi:hypothetical protein